MSTSTYSLPDLLRMWARNELTVEQAIGHILQHLVALSSHRADQEKPPTTHARQSEQAPPNTK